MSRAFSVLTAVLLMGIVVSRPRQPQFPPGYLDPAPILDRRSPGHRHRQPSMRHHRRNGVRRRRSARQESAGMLDWPRIDSLANYTRTMNWESWYDEGGVRLEAGAGARQMEVRHWLGGGRLFRRTHIRPSCSTANTRGTWTALDRRRWLCPPTSPRLAGGARAESARLPQGGGAARVRTRRRCGAGSSARWDATAPRSRLKSCASSRSRAGNYRVDATDQQGEPAAADPHVGAEPSRSAT